MAPDGSRKNAAEVRDQLERIFASESFSGSSKLQSLLRYLVEEELAGRGDRVRAKSIALDLYGYDPDEIEKRSTVVRVDAGRVRKKLKSYYDAVSDGDELRLDLPIGSYRISFQAPSEPEDAAEDPASRPKVRADRLILAAGASLALVGVVLIGWAYVLVSDSRSQLASAENGDQLSAIFEDSPTRLRAINLADEGRDLIFPAVDPERLASALQVFRFAISEDPEYFGGYAGATQVHGFMSLLTSDPDRAKEELERAREFSERAKYLAPGEAWSLSAQAWVDFVAGNHETALRLSERAVRRDPNDHHLVEFEALIALFSGEFDRVETEVERILALVGGDAGFVFTNALGSAHFHRSNYAGTVEQFEKSIAQGGPTGPVSLVYLIAAYEELGQTERAAELVELYDDSFGQQRADLLLGGVFRDPKHGRELTSALKRAGLFVNEG